MIEPAHTQPECNAKATGIIVPQSLPLPPIRRQFSLLPASLRRLASGDDSVTSKAELPLLVLTCSSISFLDSSIHGQGIKEPLYVVKTSGAATVIMRSDPWNGVHQAAKIKWPRMLPTKTKGRNFQEVLIRMANCWWESSRDILKPCSNGIQPISYKFKVFRNTQSLKWKRVGEFYQCVSSVFKKPIATFNPAVGSNPPRLQVHQTLTQKGGQPMLEHGGVSLELLDYLLVTALLLVTDIQDWRSFGESTSNSTRRSSRSSFYEFSDAQTSWGTLPRDDLVETSMPEGIDHDDEDDDHSFADAISTRSQLPASDPAHSHVHQYSSFLRIESRSPSPSSDITFFPAGSPHLETDTSLYDENVPPVPQMPAQYTQYSTQSTPQLSSSVIQQELPAPPARRPLAILWRGAARQDSTPLPRSRSTPFTPPYIDSSLSLPSSVSLPRTTPSSVTSASAGPLSSSSLASHPNSGGWRQLPRPLPLAQPPYLSVSGGEDEMRKASSRSLPETPCNETMDTSSQRWRNAEGEWLLALEREATELGDWVQRLAGHQHPLSARRAMFDLPPPAYDSLHFDDAFTSQT